MRVNVGATVMVSAMDVCHVVEGTSGGVVGAASLQAVKMSSMVNEWLEAAGIEAKSEKVGE